MFDRSEIPAAMAPAREQQRGRQSNASSPAYVRIVPCVGAETLLATYTLFPHGYKSSASSFIPDGP